MKAKKAYTLALTIIFILLVGSQMLIQYFLNKQANDAKIINIAGRQRMLSQKIVKQLLLANTKNLDANQYSEIDSSFQLFKTSHAFIEGKIELDGVFNVNEVDEGQQLIKVNKTYYPFIAAITDFLDNHTNKDSALNQVLKFEKVFLAKMNNLVTAYQENSQNKVNRLKTLEFILFLFTILVLIFEITYIFKPLINSLQKTNALLEQTGEVSKTGGWEYDTISQMLTLSAQSAHIISSHQRQLSLDQFSAYFQNQALKGQLVDQNAYESEYLITVSDQLIWIFFKKNIDVSIKDKPKIYGIIKDITYEKEAEIYKKALEDKNDSLLKLNYGLTHDIKNHTANVIALLSMLKKHEQKQNYEKLKEVLRRAEYSAQQLNQILSDFLYLSRSKEELEKSFTLIDQKKIVSAIETEIQFVSFDKSVSIDYQFNTNNVLYSNHIIKIILVNLISNSIKYSKPNEDCIIQVKLSITNNQLNISVQDNGIGMDLNSPQNKIFSLFNKVSEEQQGFGIGLSVLKKIVDQQNGTIKVDSELGLGTLISIFIPILETAHNLTT